MLPANSSATDPVTSHLQCPQQAQTSTATATTITSASSAPQQPDPSATPSAPEHTRHAANTAPSTSTTTTTTTTVHNNKLHSCSSHNHHLHQHQHNNNDNNNNNNHHHHHACFALTVAGSIHRELGIPNQDAYAVLPGDGIYAVADGHGPAGSDVSQAAVHALVANVHLGCHEAFRHAADAVDALPSASDSGTTATLAVLHAGPPRILHVANVGDSDAVLISAIPSGGGGATTTTTTTNINRKYTPLLRPSRRLSVSHRTCNQAERARVLASGAAVDGDYVVDRSANPSKMISVTRALGDKDVRPLGIIAKPDYCTVQITDDDHYLVLATDGLWDAHGGSVTLDEISNALRQLGADDGCHYLVELAAGASSHPLDDCTVLVVPLHPSISGTPSGPSD